MKWILYIWNGVLYLFIIELLFFQMIYIFFIAERDFIIFTYGIVVNIVYEANGILTSITKYFKTNFIHSIKKITRLILCWYLCQLFIYFIFLQRPFRNICYQTNTFIIYKKNFSHLISTFLNSVVMFIIFNYFS